MPARSGSPAILSGPEARLAELGIVRLFDREAGRVRLVQRVQCLPSLVVDGIFETRGNIEVELNVGPASRGSANN